MNPGSRRSRLGVRWLGVAVWLERFAGGQTSLKVAPAIEVHSGEESRIYPYERPLLDADTSIALASAVAAAPMVRRPRRVTIEGRR
jgi:hypothetical protein